VLVQTDTTFVSVLVLGPIARNILIVLIIVDFQVTLPLYLQNPPEIMEEESSSVFLRIQENGVQNLAWFFKITLLFCAHYITVSISASQNTSITIRKHQTVPCFAYSWLKVCVLIK
jgi:hypothetical protein